ncbi:amidohydrolase family protein [Simkania negevensis]|uniref:Uncharacterized protein y4mH n=1 Tax=Simkania negevensis (strain ATCC VR-1471 / DSM 27360 / Z) TaxID=331113 RepID=F8L3M7_SIMNZ|nr:amidohydrolase family protein [Simkania negevensis]CCB89886.1 uncharacterized protein y4mH [Simkania negevensis Z]
MYKGEIVDAHMHLWDLDHGDYPWIKERNPLIEVLVGDYKKIRKNFLIDDYLKMVKPHHITKSIHLEANANPKKALHETMWLQKQADTYGFPHGIVIQTDLASNDLEEELKDHLQYPNVRGARQILFREEDSDKPNLLQEYGWQKGLKLLAKYELSFELALFAHQLADATKIVREYSDVRFVLEHLGWPLDLSKEGFELWKNRLALLASETNVHFKISGISSVLKTSDQKTIEPYLLTAIELFGVDRCFFGSNFPPDSLHCTFAGLLDSLKRIFSQFDEKTQTKLFYQNAKDFYQI